MTRAQITRDQLLLAVNVFAECPQCDEEELISALVAAGFEQLESRILSAFLPLAFGRAALETMGPIDFGETVMAKTHNGVWIQIPLSDVPVYEAALALARESYAAGIVGRQSFSAVATRSAEVNAVSKALDAGQKLEGQHDESAG